MLRRRPAPASPYAHLNPAKLRVIDACFERLGCSSFADLGGIWAVDGGYSRYAADVHGATRGVLVDDDLTPAYEQAARSLPALESVVGNFGEPATAERVGAVDVCFFFDVLLHQVAPDWDAIVALYGQRCERIVVVQPQYEGPETIRLLDLGEAEYLRRIPSADTAEVYRGLWERLDETNERRGRPWRDVHDIWQWGITDQGLIERMAALGFGLRLYEHTGPWLGHRWFHEGVFVFDRALAREPAA